jgi:uncharacterized membrane protein YphA (DoxX/SURF4 family)
MTRARDSLAKRRGYSINNCLYKVLEIHGRRKLQRLFLTFPGGLPGLGLLLLRAALGITTLIQASAYLTTQSDLSVRTMFAAIAAIICGGLMLLGFFTPVIGVLLFAGGFIKALMMFSPSPQIFSSRIIYEIILSVAIILLGPGAFSLDAKLFGRREIFIPKN